MGVCPSCGASNADDAKFCPECGAGLSAPAVEVRRTVTVLFCDVVGSTSLGESVDPEVLRARLARYFERMKPIVEHHGGTVEKFIGDAVMAVFGLPTAHEDDPLRALRAAVEMRAVTPELGLRTRIGITTGEVVAGTAERLATGDAVNVAARLEQAAAPGDILCADVTMRMAGDAVEAERIEPLELKGKEQPVPAWRVLSVPELPAPRLASDSPLLGRATELRTLQAAWERARSGASCETVTVIGAAGVGKSRLVNEFLQSVQASIVRSRCLPYGEGITYWPVVGLVKALDRYRSALEPVAASSLEVLLGSAGTTSSDEIAWAVRKLFEQAASDAPLVIVLDDIQWGEEPFLDLLEHVGLMATAPILLLCMARPELLERRADWAGVVRLEPLAEADAQRLLENRLSGASIDESARLRILASAAGNPLFVEEMASMLAESDDAATVDVPPTIQALLAARLDQLDAAERTVIEHGAVEGEVFHRGSVHELTPAEGRLMARLTSLVRREIVRPERPTLVSDDAYRFRHLLIRDTAYGSIAKSRRADLHERLADWLERSGSDLIELDEITGYHFEQAHRYRDELGTADSGENGAGARGARHLAQAGRRALEHGDVGAAINLLSRAMALLPEPYSDVDLALTYTDALFFCGRLDEGLAVAESTEQSAVARGDRRAELLARVQRVGTLFWQARIPHEEVLAVCDEAIAAFESLGDERGCCAPGVRQARPGRRRTPSGPAKPSNARSATRSASATSTSSSRRWSSSLPAPT